MTCDVAIRGPYLWEEAMENGCKFCEGVRIATGFALAMTHIVQHNAERKAGECSSPSNSEF